MSCGAAGSHAQVKPPEMQQERQEALERPEPEVAAKREEPPAHIGTLFSRAELTSDIYIA